MTKVTLYKVTCTKAYSMWEQGEGFSLSAWGDNTLYSEGYDDGGKEYYLPEGYELSSTVDGMPAIFCDNKYCAISMQGNTPVLVNGDSIVKIKAV